MRAYYVPGGADDGRWVETMPNVLLAYEGSGTALLAETLTHLRHGRRALIDSGAFTAWKTGQPRSLASYVEACRALAPLALVDAFASLDVIGDWRATMVNHETMLAEGLDPMPTYHFGEPDVALDAILALDPSYLGLGGLVGKAPSVRRAWLDVVWARLVRSVVWPLRVHGWGVTDLALMTRYPWASVDSSSAISSANRGSSGGGRARVATDTTQAGKHSLVRVRQHVDRIEEAARFGTEKWAAKGIVWNEAAA